MGDESRRFVIKGLGVILLIVGAFAAVLWVRSGMTSGNEEAAIRSLREIGASQARVGGKTLRELGEAGLIADDLATGVRQGYVFGFSAGKDGWSAAATPVSHGSGERNFIITQDGVVRFSVGDAATPSSPAVPE